MTLPLVTVLLVGVLLVSTVALSRWVPKHPRWRALVIALNLFVTVRYLWWRAFETLNWEGGWGTGISLATYGAELYGFLVVLHHYVIATRESHRVSEPPDAGFSPAVDVLVASYNESPDIVRRTLVGCQAIDYRNMRVFLLDDGRRPEMQRLCRELGVNYITRPDNEGAKAGNLNHALAQTRGDFIVTLDADHVPVSSFLKETLGFFRDERVAQVQTAHHFYNPDLFQERLRSQEYVANEQDMFYHVVQPGRDVYNSSFYCGSGAVFRRSALADIDGFPMTTVTEDLHTSVLLHGRGWKSVYVNKNLSAGLAPESFEGYVTQRKRWSKGTMQVMLRRGGLFVRGLSLWQRVNYLATLWYWLYGIPRVIYLIAPLAFLLLGLRPLVLRDVTELLTFYLPHLVVSIVAFQLVNRGMRRIFWSDIYESCIAVQIALAALLMPLTASRVKFAVTPKGQAARESSRATWLQGLPLGILAVLTAVGLVRGLFVLLAVQTSDDGVLVNTIWAFYNLVVLGFGLLILRERPQQRGAVRLARAHSCRLSWGGNQAEGVTTNLSETGVSLRLLRAQPLPEQMEVTLTSREGRRVQLPARLVWCDTTRQGVSAALEFTDRTPAQHRSLIELMYSDPESWPVQTGPSMGAPEHLRRLAGSLVSTLSARRALRRLSPRLVADLVGVLVDAEGDAVAVKAVDISYAGVGLRLPPGHSMSVGATSRLTLHWNPDEETTFRVTAVTTRPAAMSETLVGTQFVDLTEAQRSALLKHLYQNGSTRQALRKVS